MAENAPFNWKVYKQLGANCGTQSISCLLTDEGVKVMPIVGMFVEIRLVLVNSMISIHEPEFLDHLRDAAKNIKAGLRVDTICTLLEEIGLEYEAVFDPKKVFHPHLAVPFDATQYERGWMLDEIKGFIVLRGGHFTTFQHVRGQWAQYDWFGPKVNRFATSVQLCEFLHGCFTVIIVRKIVDQVLFPLLYLYMFFLTLL